MADDSDVETSNFRKLHQNQPYDESLEVPDAEEVASQYSPTPRNTFESASQRLGEPKMSDQLEDEQFLDRNERSSKPKPMNPEGGKTLLDDDDDDELDDDDDECDDDDDESDESFGIVEGAYNPTDYEHLAVTSEIKELFQYITRYTPQMIELEHRLKPFIPDFIPAVGDIDAFIKIPRPDKKTDTLALTVLDEPCAKQSDPVVLDLTLRSVTKQTSTKQVAVKSIENSENNPKAITNWINSIADLHKTRPPPNVHYAKNMPDIDSLMQEWPPEVEELLKEVTLPSADLECDLSSFADITCGLFDIPVYKSRVQSLHVLFSVYSEFKNSQHFQALARDKKTTSYVDDYSYVGGGDSANQLVL